MTTLAGQHKRTLALAAALGLAATLLGLSRFGYGVLLPSMRADLGWNLTEAGLLDTCNAVGYVAGAAFSGQLLRRLTSATVLRTCAFAVTTSLLGCAVADSYPVLLALRTIAGFGASVLFVVGGYLATRVGSASGRPALVLGIYYAGVGPGILATALLVPTVLTSPRQWPLGWLVLAGICAVCAVPAGIAAGKVPKVSPAGTAMPERKNGLSWVLASFVLFGVGYVPFTTFAVEYWQQESGTAWAVTGRWALLAFAATASGWVWSRLQRRPAVALIVLLAFVMVAICAPLVSTTPFVLTASAGLFGLSFLAVSAAVTGIIQETSPPEAWPRTIAFFTTAFGVGQIAGPFLTGLLADSIGLRGGLAMTVGLLALSVFCAATHAQQKRPWLTQKTRWWFTRNRRPRQRRSIR